MIEDYVALSKQVDARIKEDLRRLLKESGLTYDDVGDKIGVPKSVISNYLSDRRGNIPSLFVAVAHELGYEFRLVKKAPK